jgi:hypothetical protein
MNREARIGVAVVVGLGIFVFAMLLIGSLGEPREELQRLTVAEALGAGSPAARFGDRDLRIVGWYAELDGDCVEGDRPPATSVPWLELRCPLRVLLAYQPSEEVTQAELEEQGLRLSASTGGPFPSRAQPGGPNLRLEQLVFLGHFDDPAAATCAPELAQRCRETFVVSDYDGLVR